MSNPELAQMLRDAISVEARARAHWQASAHDVPERDQALIAVRHSTALRKSLETWIGVRAIRTPR